MQIDELDDQGRRHLHRNGAPQKDQKVILASNKTSPSNSLLNLHKNISGVSTFFLIFVGVYCFKVWGTQLLRDLRGISKELAVT
uniref:Uncharacterized protein n=1 Tax=Romanomermis culicivorax TaxID=13658 RepID=A0A915KSP6_ROMCU